MSALSALTLPAWQAQSVQDSVLKMQGRFAGSLFRQHALSLGKRVLYCYAALWSGTPHASVLAPPHRELPCGEPGTFQGWVVVPRQCSTAPAHILYASSCWQDRMHQLCAQCLHQWQPSVQKHFWKSSCSLWPLARSLYEVCDVTRRFQDMLCW